MNLLKAIWQLISFLFIPQTGKQRSKQERLKNDITYLIGQEIADGNLDMITPLYISKVLNAPLEEVEQYIKDNNLL